MTDRTLSKDLKPGTRLSHNGSIVTLDRRKSADEPGRSLPFHTGWWLKDNRGGLADFVIDDPENGWQIVGVPGAEGTTSAE